MERFIVKVQISLTTDQPCRQALIYNEDHSVLEQFDATRELIDRVGPENNWKKFIWARVDEEKRLILEEDAPYQDDW